jgi:histidinol-phosphate/aromatic aminotransferase/cobyric acid decarboxylase-like protein
LTKVFACPGLRLGYVVAPDDRLATQVRRRQPEWSVNGVAVEALPELLDRAELAAWAAAVARLRDQLVGLLAEHGLVADPSDANYLLVRSAPGLRDALAANGILVRDATSFGWPAGVRIAVPGERGLDRLARALP